MQNYKYSARNKEGAVFKGSMEARSRTDVVESLQQKDLIVVKVDVESGFGLEALKEINIGGVPMADKVIFMRQLSTMISAGLPLSQALEILESQAENPKFKKVLTQVSDDVQGGSSLAKAFRKNDDVFDEITINLLEAGEESGNLEDILQRLADEMESQKELRDKMRSAFIYPVVISVVVVAVIAILIFVLVPAMKEIYDDFDAELPWATQLLIDLSNFMYSYWWAILITLASFAAGIKYYLDTTTGRENFDKLILKLPVVGNLMTKMQVTQFTRVLSLLLKSGLSILEALRLTAGALSNTQFRNAVESARSEVERGVNISDPIARSEQFPLIVSQMIAVGEESGEIDGILEKLAEYYNKEVNVMTDNLTTLLEPIILVVVGVVIGFIALAVYMPMFSIVEVIG